MACFQFTEPTPVDLVPLLDTIFATWVLEAAVVALRIFAPKAAICSRPRAMIGILVFRLVHVAFRTLCTLGAIPYMGVRGSQFKDSNGGVLSVCLLGFEIPVVMRSLV